MIILTGITLTEVNNAAIFQALIDASEVLKLIQSFESYFYKYFKYITII